MDIVIENLSKKFQFEWVFKNINFHLDNKSCYGVIGSNGSGKSTLLQVIAGILSPTKGSVKYQSGSQSVSVEEIYKYISLATPYLELIEEFSLNEIIDFHFQFKKIRPGIDKKQLMEILTLEKAKNKAIKYFSSGMKQRVKLGLAFYSDTPVLLLDEPTTNLDKQGIDWYLNEIKHNINHRLIVICSNQTYEYDFTQKLINISDYK